MDNDVIPFIRSTEIKSDSKLKDLNELIEQEQRNEAFMKQFQSELQRFTELDITNKEILCSIFQRLIDRIKIQENGAIIILYILGIF